MGNRQNGGGGATAAATKHSLSSTSLGMAAGAATHTSLARRCSDYRAAMAGGASPVPSNINSSSLDGASSSSNGTGTLPKPQQLDVVINGGMSRANMRRRWSSVATVNARSAASLKPKRLLPRQCHLIIKSWNKKSGRNRLGRDIFIAIFNEAEELKPLFGVDRLLRGKRLRADPHFVAHTTLFTDTLDFAVRNLDDIALVTENAEQLGRRHAAIFQSHADAFRVEYWGMFTECIVETITGSSAATSAGTSTGNGSVGFGESGSKLSAIFSTASASSSSSSAVVDDKETQLAWRQFVNTLIFYMKLGYERETLRMTRNASMRRAHHYHHQQQQQNAQQMLAVTAMAVKADTALEKAPPPPPATVLIARRLPPSYSHQFHPSSSFGAD